MDAVTIAERPAEARRVLLSDFRKAGALLSVVARSYGVHRITLSRWIEKLGAGDEIRSMRARARAEGWAAGGGRGKRGPDHDTKRSSAKRAKSARRRWREARKAR